MLSTETLSMPEVAARAKMLYETRIRALVEADNIGKHLTINVETGEWEMGDDDLETARRGRAKYPDAQLFGMKIGYPAVDAVGGVLRPLIANLHESKETDLP